MATRDELMLYSEAILSAVERLIACLEGFSRDEINWRPPAPEANSLHVLAVHTMANAEENVLSVFGGEDVPRDRDAEFVAVGEAPEAVRQHWDELKARIVETIANASPDELDRERTHPRRGTITGRKALLITATHAAEHMGQAELTRDLMRGRT